MEGNRLSSGLHGRRQIPFTLGVFHDVGCRPDRELPEPRSLRSDPCFQLR